MHSGTLDRLIQKLAPEDELSNADRENAYRAYLHRGNLYLNLVNGRLRRCNREL